MGKAIYDLQCGESLGMPLSRTMPAVGGGVSELRFRDQSGIYRVFYYLKLAKGILVFHAFTKKAKRTPDQEIELGRRRLQELLHEEA